MVFANEIILKITIIQTSDEQERIEPSPPSNSPPMFATSTLNRLVANNGELTITTTHGPVSVGIKSSPGSQHSAKDDDEDLLSNSSRNYLYNLMKIILKSFFFKMSI